MNSALLKIPVVLIVILMTSSIPAERSLGSLHGKVFFPAKKKRSLSTMKSYDQKRPTSSYNDGIVYLTPLDQKPGQVEMRRAVLTQKGLNFIPHVLPVRVGQKVYILNEDNEYHNVFSRTSGASFNIGRRPPGHLYPQSIRKAGVIKVFCDIHKHMNAYVLALNTPYFTRVRKDRSYSLRNLPNGRYKLEVYHPEYPSVVKQIEIRNSSRKEFNINW